MNGVTTVQDISETLVKIITAIREAGRDARGGPECGDVGGQPPDEQPTSTG